MELSQVFSRAGWWALSSLLIRITWFTGLKSWAIIHRSYLAGRAINDYMPMHVVEIAVKALNEVGKVIKKTFHKSFIKNCPSGGVCFYTFLYVKVVKR